MISCNDDAVDGRGLSAVTSRTLRVWEGAKAILGPAEGICPLRGAQRSQVEKRLQWDNA